VRFTFIIVGHIAEPRNHAPVVCYFAVYYFSVCRGWKQEYLWRFWVKHSDSFLFMKRMFGEYVSARRFPNMVIEMMLKASLYNEFIVRKEIVREISHNSSEVMQHCSCVLYYGRHIQFLHKHIPYISSSVIVSLNGRIISTVQYSSGERYLF
jgi:hypothetical protein